MSHVSTLQCPPLFLLTLNATESICLWYPNELFRLKLWRHDFSLWESHTRNLRTLGHIPCLFYFPSKKNKQKNIICCSSWEIRDKMSCIDPWGEMSSLLWQMIVHTVDKNTITKTYAVRWCPHYTNAQLSLAGGVSYYISYWQIYTL